MTAFLGTALGDLLGWLLLIAVFGFWGVFSFLRSDDRRMLAVKWACSAVLVFSYFVIAWLHNVVFSLLYIIPSVLLAFLWCPSRGRC